MAKRRGSGDDGGFVDSSAGSSGEVLRSLFVDALPPRHRDRWPSLTDAVDDAESWPCIYGPGDDCYFTVCAAGEGWAVTVDPRTGIAWTWSQS